jgi:hypothetical protein
MPHDDFQVEPVRGLPELPPAGEHILWQGAPDWRALARESLWLNWVALYFVALAIWRAVAVWPDLGTAAALRATVPFLILGLVACAILALIAFIQARATVYTITNRRVALRIGAALTVTLNLPFTQIVAADLDLRRGGTGTLAFRIADTARLSYLVCWPHVRPWAMSPTQPALRCIPEADRIARLFADAARTRVGETTALPAAAVAAE